MTKTAAPTEAKKAGNAISPTITEVDGSHMIMLSHPETVADVILTAAAAVDRQPIPAGR
jgi:hypothetical protein